MVEGLQHAFFYDSNDGDRKYSAACFEYWLKKFFRTGVFNGDLKVIANSSMSVTVSPGYCNVEGKVRFFQEDTVIEIPTAGSVQDRIDSIVIERNDIERDITLKLVRGEYAEKPAAKELVRSGGIYQLAIAQIRVKAGAVKITQVNIKDTRTSLSLCGLVAGTVSEMDFSQLQAQFETFCAESEETFKAWFDNTKSESEEEFSKWFDGIKNQLSKTADGNLQLQLIAIDDIYDSVSVYMADVDADTYYPTSDASILVGNSLTNIDVVAQNGYYTHLQAVKKGDLLVLANDYNFGATSDNQNLIVLNDERTVIDLVPFLELNDTRAYRIKEDGFIFISCKYIEWALDIHLFDVKTPKSSSNGDYTLTEADKQEIAQLVLNSLPAAEEAVF